MTKHGRESTVVFRDTYVIKTPLRSLSYNKKQEWLERQLRAGETTEYLANLSDGAYGVPSILSKDERNKRISEEKMSGVPFVPLIMKNISESDRNKVIDSFAHFLADIHSYNQIPNPVEYKLDYILDISALQGFMCKNMHKYAPRYEIRFLDKCLDAVQSQEYQSKLVWSHCDLFAGNVLFDSHNAKVSVIDFTDVGYTFIHHDLLNPYLYELGIAREVCERYLKYTKLTDLPANITNLKQLQGVINYHDAAQILDNLNIKAQLFDITNNENKPRLASIMMNHVAKLHAINLAH